MDTPDWISEDNLNKPFIFLPVVLSVCLKHIEYVYLVIAKAQSGLSKNAKGKTSFNLRILCALCYSFAFLR
jgi:hypothetical protein